MVQKGESRLLWLALTVIVMINPVAHADNQEDTRDAELRMLRNSLKRLSDETEPLRAKIKAKDRQIENIQLTIARLTKEREELKAAVGTLTGEIAKMKDARLAEIRDRAAAQNGEDGPLKVLPLLGDEVSAAKLKADPKSFLNSSIILGGGLEIDNYYNYGFEHAQDTHYSLSFHATDKGLRTLERWQVYAERPLAKPLVELLSQAQDKGAVRAIRLKLRVTERCFENNQWSGYFELIDWQVLNRDRASWSKWAVKPD